MSLSLSLLNRCARVHRLALPNAVFDCAICVCVCVSLCFVCLSIAFSSLVLVRCPSLYSFGSSTSSTTGNCIIKSHFVLSCCIIKLTFYRSCGNGVLCLSVCVVMQHNICVITSTFVVCRLRRIISNGRLSIWKWVKSGHRRVGRTNVEPVSCSLTLPSCIRWNEPNFVSASIETLHIADTNTARHPFVIRKIINNQNTREMYPSRAHEQLNILCIGVFAFYDGIIPVSQNICGCQTKAGNFRAFKIPCVNWCGCTQLGSNSMPDFYDFVRLLLLLLNIFFHRCAATQNWSQTMLTNTLVKRFMIYRSASSHHGNKK